MSKCRNVAYAFTLVELLVVVGTLGLVLALGLPALVSFGRRSDVGAAAEELVGTLRQAQSKTVASEDGSRYGVYFATSTTPQQYTLFKGADYASRDATKDILHRLASTIEISDVALTNGASETAFDRIVGTTATSGTVVLRVKANPAKTETVQIFSSGRVRRGAETAVAPTPTPRDSRHVRVAYSRFITTATETLTLAFDAGAVTQTFSVAGALKNGQLDWQGTVGVAGENQTLRIRTLRLNNPDTQFSVFRDRSKNTKSVTLRLSGDTSGTFLEYWADGLTTLKTSVYAAEPEWR